jgi:hypothetical protein
MTTVIKMLTEGETNSEWGVKEPSDLIEWDELLNSST